MLLAVVAVLAMGHPVAGNSRKQLAADMVGLHSAFMEVCAHAGLAIDAAV